MPQSTQAAPPIPQANGLFVLHVVPAQQPSGQEIGSQTQLPLKHRCPEPHADPPSQWHTPSTHASPVKPQSKHAAPPMPQAAGFGGAIHVVPEQQPPGHEAALQTQAPPAQAWPAPHAGPDPHWQTPFAQESAVVESHATHATPPVPQADALGVMQAVPAQHPFGHETESQTQVPFRHLWPGMQGERLIPQEQVPPTQPSARRGLQAKHA
jgi:hypothetical protein